MPRPSICCTFLGSSKESGRGRCVVNAVQYRQCVVLCSLSLCACHLLCACAVCRVCAACVPRVCHVCAACVPRVCRVCAACVPRVCRGCAACVPRVCVVCVCVRVLLSWCCSGCMPLCSHLRASRRNRRGDPFLHHRQADLELDSVVHAESVVLRGVAGVSGRGSSMSSSRCGGEGGAARGRTVAPQCCQHTRGGSAGPGRGDERTSFISFSRWTNIE